MLKLRALRFRARWGWSAVAAAALAAAVALGNWQLHRAGEKLALQERLDERSRGAVLQLPAQVVPAEAVEYFRVAARGEYLPQHTILLDNRVLGGRVGYHVLTPLRIGGGSLCVLVNRGWVAAGPRREILPQFPTPAGVQEVEGIAVPPARRYFELGPATNDGPVWQNLALDRYAVQTGLSLQPFLLQQQNAADDGLARIRERPDTGVNMHRGYAFQWYALGILIIVLYVALNLKPRHDSQA